MFANVKNPFQKKSFTSLIKWLSEQPNNYGSVPKEKIDKLVAADNTLCLIGAVDPQNDKNVYVQLTPAGAAAAAALTPADVAPVERATVPTDFSFGTLTDLPVSRRGGPKAESYPFEKLTAPTPTGDGKFAYSYFVVPATESRPNPVKSLQSTVNSATKRYSKADDKRKFVVRPQTDPATNKVVGAFIIREL